MSIFLESFKMQKVLDDTIKEGMRVPKFECFRQTWHYLHTFYEYMSTYMSIWISKWVFLTQNSTQNEIQMNNIRNTEWIMENKIREWVHGCMKMRLPNGMAVFTIRGNARIWRHGHKFVLIWVQLENGIWGEPKKLSLITHLGLDRNLIAWST